MNEDQADQIIDLLGSILGELQGLREGFDEFTGYNVYKMSVAIEDLGDRITGGAAGVGGGTLDELGSKLDMIEINTST
jgi:hypothetical protein